MSIAELSPGCGRDGTPIGRGSSFGVNLYVFRPYDLGASISGSSVLGAFAAAPASPLLEVGVGDGFDVAAEE
jgi:hypothetical protein